MPVQVQSRHRRLNIGNKQLQETQKDKGFVGTLKIADLIDLIQVCCLSSVSVAIRIAEATETGAIYIADGQIVHAATTVTEGEEALFEILSWPTGSFETLGEIAAPKQSIQKPYQHLLLEAARHSDEKRVSNPDQTQFCTSPGVSEKRQDDPTAAGPSEGEKNDELLFADSRDVSDNEPANKDRSQESGGLEAAGDTFDPLVDLVRVLVVDDSASMCRILTGIIEADDRLKVVGTAGNGEEALRLISELQPDVLTLDVNMPVMNGSTTLKHIMVRTPCPVVIISNPGEYGRLKIIDFLRLGAVDFIDKPSRSEDMENQKQRIHQSLHQASQAQLNRFSRGKAVHARIDQEKTLLSLRPDTPVVLVNSGAGGFAELFKIIPALPAAMPGVVIVRQSMSDGLAQTLVDYLDRRCPIAVRTVENETRLQAGCCYIAGDATPLIVEKRNQTLYLRFAENLNARGPEKEFDHLMQSMSAVFADQFMTIILSGARLTDPMPLLRTQGNGRRVLLQAPETALIPKPLQKILKADRTVRGVPPVQLADQIQHFVNRVI
jgi:two-component system chemotaxis response regulator CheB